MKKIEQFQETENKLMEAYEILLENNSKISVDKICEEANLHHQTFYRHFKNKEEFFVYYITKKIDNFIERNDYLSSREFCLTLLTTALAKPRLMHAYLRDPQTRQIISNKFLHYLGIKIGDEYPIQNREEIFFLIGGLLYYIIQCVTHFEMIDIEHAKVTLSGIFDKITKALQQ